MKPSTEVALRSVLSADNEIGSEIAETAISALRERRKDHEKIVELLRIKNVCRMLCLSQTSIHKYINRGLLDRVCAAGKWTLGISKDSYIRFTESRRFTVEKERLARHPPPPRPSGWAIRKRKREILKRKIAYALRKFKSEPRLQLYFAIESYLKEHPEHSYHLVCEAVGIPAPSYRYHLTQSKAGMTESDIKRREILQLAQSLVPDKSLPVNVCQLTRAMNRHRHHFSDTTVGRVLKLNGYIVSGPGRKPETSTAR